MGSLDKHVFRDTFMHVLIKTVDSLTFTPSIEALQEAIDKIALIPDSQSLAGLSQRKKLELEFYDKDRDASLIKERIVLN